MRIAAITNSRIPSLTANSIQAMKVCEALVDLGHETRLFAPREGAPATAAALEAHYGLQRAPQIEWHGSSRPLRRLDFVVRAQRASNRFGAEMIYTWLPQSAAMGLWRKKPVVLEMHGDVGGSGGARWLRLFWRLPGRKRMAVTTRALRSALEGSAGHAFPGEAVIVAPNGIDLVRYQDLPGPSEARRHLDLEQKPTLGFSGHLYAGRGADLLFELARRMPELNFLWIGGTPESVKLWRARLREARMTNVTMTGFVENRRLPLYQAAADILVMPYGKSIKASSGQEIAEVINPMKMFEYMAAGRAIVTADLSVLHEVLSAEDAVFCAPGDADSWERALRSLLRDEGRRNALAARVRQQATAHTWLGRQRSILGDLTWAH
jgi:glycosyltransferase involved in cell wall biosynthesis